MCVDPPADSATGTLTETASMFFRLSLAGVFVVGLLSSAPAQDRFRVYFGTYTDQESKGIYQCELNLKDLSLIHI